MCCYKMQRSHEVKSWHWSAWCCHKCLWELSCCLSEWIIIKTFINYLYLVIKLEKRNKNRKKMRNMSAWFICRCRNSSVKLLNTCTKNFSRKDVLLIHNHLTRKMQATIYMIVLESCFFVILFPGRVVSYKLYSCTLSNLILSLWWLLENALQQWLTQNGR